MNISGAKSLSTNPVAEHSGHIKSESKLSIITSAKLQKLPSNELSNFKIEKLLL